MSCVYADDCLVVLGVDVIDYEKLKKAQELCEKLKEHWFEVGFAVNPVTPGAIHIRLIDGADDLKVNNILDLDCLIEQLTKLTQPKPKYKVGDPAYTYGNDIYAWTVETIYWEPDIDDYRVNLFAEGRKASLTQSDLYSSVEALIEAQINYWTDLRKPTPVCAPSTKKCQHESDYTIGQIVDKTDMSEVTELKCKKCGEFYR